jgi:hypothetical protein
MIAKHHMRRDLSACLFSSISLDKQHSRLENAPPDRNWTFICALFSRPRQQSGRPFTSVVGAHNPTASPPKQMALPYAVQLDADTARRLAENGATVLMLGVPPGTLIGIDQQV